LNKLLLHVHPDFFSAFPNKKAVNNASLQTLQKCFHLLHEYQHPRNLLLELKKIKFYVKGKGNDSPIYFKFLTNNSNSDVKLIFENSVIEMCRELGIEVKGEENECREKKEESFEELFRKREEHFEDTVRDVFTLVLWFEKRNFFFDKLMTTNEKIKCMWKIYNHLMELDYNQWKHVPVIISDNYNVNSKGFFIIPHDFKVDEAKTFFSNKIKNN
jgi:hypothetical protein